jgi:hypothetical protein
VRGTVGLALSLDADYGTVAGRVEEQVCRTRAMTAREYNDART